MAWRGQLQSHHIFQNEWAKKCLGGYKPGSAPTMLIETNNEQGFNGKDLGFKTQPLLPHDMITAQQNARRGAVGFVCSELRSAVEDSATDLLHANFKESDVKCAMVFVYDMLTTLGKQKGTDFDVIPVGGDTLYEADQAFRDSCYSRQTR